MLHFGAYSLFSYYQRTVQTDISRQIQGLGNARTCLMLVCELLNGITPEAFDFQILSPLACLTWQVIHPQKEENHAMDNSSI